MAVEKKWLAIEARAFTADGTSGGDIFVADTVDYRVKMRVVLNATGFDPLALEVKRVISKTHLKVGPASGKIYEFADISAYTVLAGSTIEAAEQDRVRIPIDDHERAVYEEEPVMAKRSILVNKYGNKIDTENPLDVRLSDGSINIGTVNAELEVQLSHIDGVPDSGDVADSVQVGDGVSGATLKVDLLNRSISTNRYEKLIGLLANANWMKLGDFDQIVPNFSGNIATLDYKQSGAIIGRAIFTFVTDSDWNIELKRYINDSDNSILLDDDDSELFLD